MKYYLIKLLTNTQGQDGSALTAVYTEKEKALVGYHDLLKNLHNSQDVLYAVVEIINEFGNIETMEEVDHRPTPEPEEE